MNIQFEQEGDSIFAIAKNQVYKSRQCDELLYAEITKKENVFWLSWEGDFPRKMPFSTEELARAEVLRNYSFHYPYINGASFEIEDND